jgi:hypothetical protein
MRKCVACAMHFYTLVRIVYLTIVIYACLYHSISIWVHLLDAANPLCRQGNTESLSGQSPRFSTTPVLTQMLTHMFLSGCEMLSVNSWAGLRNAIPKDSHSIDGIDSASFVTKVLISQFQLQRMGQHGSLPSWKPFVVTKNGALPQQLANLL